MTTHAVDLDEDDFEVEPNVPEGFVVRDQETLFWALRKAAGAESRIRENAQSRDAELDRVNSWYRRATRSDRRTVEYFGMLATEYLRQRIEAGEERKSIDTPHGRVMSRQGAGKVVVTDELKIPDRYRKAVTKYEVDKSALKADLEQGEIVEGAKYEPPARTFRVELVP